MLSNFSVWFHWQRYSGELFDLVAITVIVADFDAKVVAVAVMLPLLSLLPLPSETILLNCQSTK
jgi:hypothetical protein